MPTPLTPLTTHILLALTHGDMSATEILKQIGEDSQSTLLPRYAVFYKALHRMLYDRLITKPNYRTFSLTPTGRSRLIVEQNRINRLAQVLRNQL